MNFIVFSLLVQWAVATNIPIHTFSGIHYTTIDDMIIYESSLPLTYVFPIDNIRDNTPNNLNIRFPPCPTQQHKSCINNSQTFKPSQSPINNRNISPFNCLTHEFVAENTPACTIANNTIKLHQAINDLLQKFKPSEQNHSTSRQKRGIQIIGQIFDFCCDLVTHEKLHNTYLSQESAIDHLNRIQQIVHQDHKDLLQSSQIFHSTTTKIEETLQQAENEVQSLADHIEKHETSELQLTYHMLAASFNIHMQTYAALYQQYLNHINYFCDKKLIPSSLITEKTLKEDLSILETKIKPFNYQLAILQENIQLYYQNPLVSCIKFPNSTLFKIQIPIRKIQPTPQLLKVTPAPLLWQEQICQLSSENLFIINQTSGAEIINTLNCNPEKSKLCNIPRATSTRSMHSCAKGIIQGLSIHELKHICKFTCTSQTTEVIITQVTTTTFYLTNIQPQTYIVCENDHQNIKPVQGLLYVELPCKCQIRQGNEVLIKEKFPCDSRTTTIPTIKHLIPHLWISNLENDISIHTTKTFPIQTDLDLILNHKWNLTFPTMTIYDKLSEDVFKEVPKDSTWTKLMAFESHNYIIFIWLLFLTVLSLYTLYKTKIQTALNKHSKPETLVLSRLDLREN